MFDLKVFPASFEDDPTFIAEGGLLDRSFANKKEAYPAQISENLINVDHNVLASFQWRIYEEVCRRIGIS